MHDSKLHNDKEHMELEEELAARIRAKSVAAYCRSINDGYKVKVESRDIFELVMSELYLEGHTVKEFECISRETLTIKIRTMEQEQQTENKVLTYGEKAVGLNFNPSNDSAVDRIKQKAAALIDELNDLREASTNGEEKRMYSIAITEIQSGQVWGVKAATWKY